MKQVLVRHPYMNQSYPAQAKISWYYVRHPYMNQSYPAQAKISCYYVRHPIANKLLFLDS